MNLLGGKIGMGIAVGVGAAMVLPAAARILSGIAKPVLKEGIKGGMVVAEKGKMLYAEAMESIEDIAAEARSERKESKSKA